MKKSTERQSAKHQSKKHQIIKRQAKAAKVTKVTKAAQKDLSTKNSASPKSALDTYNRQQLTKSLKIDAKAIGIAPGAAEIFIEKTLDAVEESLHSKKTITEHDLTVAIAKELKKYNRDFAYIYQNRDKII